MWKYKTGLRDDSSNFAVHICLAGRPAKSYGNSVAIFELYHNKLLFGYFRLQTSTSLKNSSKSLWVAEFPAAYFVWVASKLASSQYKTWPYYFSCVLEYRSNLRKIVWFMCNAHSKYLTSKAFFLITARRWKWLKSMKMECAESIMQLVAGSNQTTLTYIAQRGWNIIMLCIHNIHTHLSERRALYAF